MSRCPKYVPETSLETILIEAEAVLYMITLSSAINTFVMIVFKALSLFSIHPLEMISIRIPWQSSNLKSTENEVFVPSPEVDDLLLLEVPSIYNTTKLQ